MRRTDRQKYLAAEPASPAAEPEPPGERAFGLTVGLVLAAIAGWSVWRSGLGPFAVAFGALASLLLTAAFLEPALLRAPNRLWFRFGLILHHVVNPVVMLAIYLFAVLPTALLRRLFGRSPITKKPDPAAASYWRRPDPVEPARTTMHRQF